MLFRIDPEDHATPATMQACAHAVDELAAHQVMAMVEPFISRRDDDGRIRNDLTTEAVVRSATVAAGLASTSAYTWLKLPVVDDMDVGAGRHDPARRAARRRGRRPTRARSSRPGPRL